MKFATESKCATGCQYYDADRKICRADMSDWIVCKDGLRFHIVQMDANGLRHRFEKGTLYVGG